MILVFSFLLMPVQATDYSLYWREDPPQLEEYAFTFAFVGDTQIVTYQNSTLLHILYDWLVENKDAQKPQFVAGLGDITDATPFSTALPVVFFNQKGR